MILALTEGDEWLFLDPECSRRSLRDWTQHLEIRGYSPTSKGGMDGCRLVLIFSSEKRTPWRKGRGPCCRLGASVQTWAGGAIQDHPGREAGFKRRSQAGQGPGKRCPVTSPAGPAGAGWQLPKEETQTQGGGTGRGCWDDLPWPRPPAPGSSGGHGLALRLCLFCHFAPSFPPPSFPLHLGVCVCSFSDAFLPFPSVRSHSAITHILLFHATHIYSHGHDGRARCQARESGNRLDLVQTPPPSSVTPGAWLNFSESPFPCFTK